MSAGNTQLLDRLLKEQRINAQQYESARLVVTRENAWPQDVLVQEGILDEADMLRFVAALHRTRFVSTQKLSKAEIDRSTLELIPREMAEQMLVFPVVYSARDKTLAFVVADPGEKDAIEKVKATAGAAAVKAYVARPGAIRAAIHKHYRGDIHAFAKLDQRGYDEFKQMLDTYERNLFDEDGVNVGAGSVARDLEDGAVVSETTPGVEPGAASSLDASPPDVFAPEPDSRRHQTAVDADAEDDELSTNTMVQDTRGTSQASSGPSANLQTGHPIELVGVMVALLENQRAELRGHSAQVSRTMQRIGEHMGLSPADVYALRLAGLLHDVGKTSSYHLTLLNVAEYEGHRAQARKGFMSPVRLFESAELPVLCLDGLTHMYERFDGRGFPDRRAGKDIPLAARLLGIAETYADLTANARNPFRKTLSPKAAHEVLLRYRETVFDPNLVDLFRVAILGEDQAEGGEDRPRVVLVDSDPEETMVLELRLQEAGCDVMLCRNASQAYKFFQEGSVDAMIVEVELRPHDGFSLVEHIRKKPAGTDLPVLFLTCRADRASVDRGFSLGAVDYIIKPAAPDVVVAKARNALQRTVRTRGGRGVSGSLSEMPLPEVLQVVARARKTGRLKVASAGYVGEVHFGDGEVHNAKWMNVRGEEAVYAMLQLTDGDFALDPSFQPEGRVVFSSTENLLLEGMRRWDEERNDFGATRVE